MELFHRFKWRFLTAIIFIVVAFLTWLPLTQLSGEPTIARLMPALGVAFWLKLAVTFSRAVFKPKLDFQEICQEAVRQGKAFQVAALLVLEQMFYVTVIVWIAYGN